MSQQLVSIHLCWVLQRNITCLTLLYCFHMNARAISLSSSAVPSYFTVSVVRFILHCLSYFYEHRVSTNVNTFPIRSWRRNVIYSCTQNTWFRRLKSKHSSTKRNHNLNYKLTVKQHFKLVILKTGKCLFTQNTLICEERIYQEKRKLI